MVLLWSSHLLWQTRVAATPFRLLVAFSGLASLSNSEAAGDIIRAHCFPFSYMRSGGKSKLLPIVWSLPISLGTFFPLRASMSQNVPAVWLISSFSASVFSGHTRFLISLLRAKKEAQECLFHRVEVQPSILKRQIGVGSGDPTPPSVAPLPNFLRAALNLDQLSSCTEEDLHPPTSYHSLVKRAVCIQAGCVPD